MDLDEINKLNWIVSRDEKLLSQLYKGQEKTNGNNKLY